MKQYIARSISRLNSWQYRYYLYYTILGILAIVSYITVYDKIIDQSCYFIMVITDITLSLILLFFMWGIISDKIFKKYSSRTRWILWGVGLFLLILFFKFVGGYETRWL